MHIRKQREHFFKKDRLIYLIYYSMLTQTRLKAEQLDSRWLGVNRIFKKCERAVVCPASCERSYEGIGFNGNDMVWD